MPDEVPSADDVPIFTESFSDLVLRQQGTEEVTNEATPRIGGIAPPGGIVTVTIDSDTPNAIEVPVRYHGDGRVWEAVVPELSDGPHTLDWGSTIGGGSGFGFTVQANEAERAQSEQRNQEWLESGGRDEWVEGQLKQSGSLTPPTLGPRADGRATKTYRDAKAAEAAGAVGSGGGVEADEQAGQEEGGGETFADRVTREQAERLATPEGQQEYAETLHRSIAAEQGLTPGDPGYLEFMNALEAFRHRMAAGGVRADDDDYLDRLYDEFNLKSASSGGGGSGLSGGGSGEAPLTASPVVPVPQGSGGPPAPPGGQGGAGGGSSAGGGGPGAGQGGQPSGSGSEGQQGQGTSPQPRTGDEPPRPPAILGLEKGNTGIINA